MESSLRMLEQFIYPAIGVFLLAAVLVWFIKLNELFNYLKCNHIDIYKSIGEPKLFTNNSPSNNFAFLRFIFSNEGINSSDKFLERSCKFLVYFVCVYCLVFASYIIYIAMSVRGL